MRRNQNILFGFFFTEQNIHESINVMISGKQGCAVGVCGRVLGMSDRRRLFLHLLKKPRTVGVSKLFSLH